MFSIWLRQLRIHQWSKNLLLVVPLLTSFQSPTSSQIFSLVGGFIALSFVASAGYVFNDILDVAGDRNHVTKRNRPLAAGQINLFTAKTVAVGLVVAGFAIAWAISVAAVLQLAVYALISAAYSFWLKKIAILDVLILAGLYTLRVVVGGFLVGVQVSFWLLSFSVFFFLSIAWLKRSAEIKSMSPTGESEVARRGYSVSDLSLINGFGTAAGFMSVLVFSLYLDSAAIRTQYAVPEIAWLDIPFLIYLIGRMWLKAHRGQMNQDPVVFLFRDWPSLLTVLLMGVALYTAHVGFAL